MGIKLSKNPLVEENFDGEGGDYTVDASNLVVELTPDWFTTNSEIRQLKEDLKRLTTVPKEVAPFNFEDRVVAAKCVKVYDGDTAHFAVDYQGQWVRFRCRMLGYNSAEMVPPSHLSDEEREKIKKQAKSDRDYLAELLLDKYVLLHLHKFDKYGRPLTDVYLVDDVEKIDRSLFEDPSKHVNALMLKHGHGVPYEMK